MSGLTDQEKLEQVYLVLSDLRYLLHKEDNTLEDYRKICRDNYKRVAESAGFLREILPDEVVAKHDEE